MKKTALRNILCKERRDVHLLIQKRMNEKYSLWRMNEQCFEKFSVKNEESLNSEENV